MNKSANRPSLYDAAKVLATVLVVVAHATVMYTDSGAIDVSGTSCLLTYLTEYIYSFHMPLFFFLSGCVYGYCIELGKYERTLPFIFTKFKRLIIPYLFFGLFVVTPTMLMLGLWDSGLVNYVYRGIVLALNARHLWYLPALFFIFVLSAVYRPLIKKGNGGLAAAVLLSLTLYFLARFVPWEFQLRAACNYQIFFMAGIIFNRFCGKLCVADSWQLPVGALLLAALLLQFVYNPNDLTDRIYSFVGIGGVMLLCTALLCRFPAITDNRIYKLVKENAFGIYLFHPMIIYVLYYALGSLGINPIILSSCIAVTAFALSILLTVIVRKLHLRTLLGE